MTDRLSIDKKDLLLCTKSNGLECGASRKLVMMFCKEGVRSLQRTSGTAMGMSSGESWLGVGAGSSLQAANRHLHSGAVRNLCKGKSTQIKGVNTVSIGIE